MQERVKNHNLLLNQGLIRIPWNNPTIFTIKADNSVRAITDFRWLNQRISCIFCSLEPLEDVLNKLAGIIHYAKFDIAYEDTV